MHGGRMQTPLLQSPLQHSPFEVQVRESVKHPPSPLKTPASPSPLASAFDPSPVDVSAPSPKLGLSDAPSAGPCRSSSRPQRPRLRRCRPCHRTRPCSRPAHPCRRATWPRRRELSSCAARRGKRHAVGLMRRFPCATRLAVVTTVTSDGESEHARGSLTAGSSTWSRRARRSSRPSAGRPRRTVCEGRPLRRACAPPSAPTRPRARSSARRGSAGARA